MDNAYSAGQKLLCGSYTQYTPSGKANFIRMGCFGKEPKIGAVVYFYGKTMGRVNHVGIVTQVKKNGNRYEILTVEGNTSAGTGFSRNGGCVAAKSYEFALNEVGNDNRINGFGYPQFDSNTCTVEEFIAVAKAEIGYVEKDSKKDLDNKGANAGSKNFTKYGEWYKNNGVYWCQQFVSWCAYEACKTHKSNTETGWIQVGSRWKYGLHGTLVKNQWLVIGGRWYAFDGEGFMVTGWFLSEGGWYYLNPKDGAMLANQWITVDGKSYYLCETGIMATSCYIIGDPGEMWWVDSNGVCQVDEVAK
jgi:FOG: Glucan-binding domain (YG repeat)